MAFGWSQRDTRHATQTTAQYYLDPAFACSLSPRFRSRRSSVESSYDFAPNDRSCPNVVRPIELTFLEDYAVGQPEERIPPLGHGEGRSDEQYEEALLDTQLQRAAQREQQRNACRGDEEHRRSRRRLGVRLLVLGSGLLGRLNEGAAARGERHGVEAEGRR